MLTICPGIAKHMSMVEARSDCEVQHRIENGIIPDEGGLAPLISLTRDQTITRKEHRSERGTGRIVRMHELSIANEILKILQSHVISYNPFPFLQILVHRLLIFLLSVTLLRFVLDLYLLNEFYLQLYALIFNRKIGRALV